VETAPGNAAVKLALLLLTPAAIWLAVRPLSSPERRLAWVVSLFATCFCEVLHYWIVDKGHLFPISIFSDNTAWQKWLHRGVLELDPRNLPHSYRFLPACVVAIFERLGGSFEFGRLAYRLLANGLLFSVVYRYARIYLNGLGAAAVVLLLVLLYPITILMYAGQMTDPASHLSFAVCLYCLATGYEAGFGASLLLGVFAKESIILMAIARAFYGLRRVRGAALALVYFSAALALAVGIRLCVNHGTLSYARISGIGPSQVLANLNDVAQWGPLWLVSLGAL